MEPDARDTSRATNFDTVAHGIAGLTPLMMLVMCRAALIAYYGPEQLPAPLVRELSLHEAMVMVGDLPYECVSQVMMAVGDVDLDQVLAFRDACKVINDAQAAFSLVLDPDAPARTIEAEVGIY